MYSDTDREIAKACGELARFGIAGRNLRILRTSADREAQPLEQVMPALRPLTTPAGARRSRTSRRSRPAPAA